MSDYIKHVIECQCTLQLFKNKTKPVYHKFKVCTFLNESDECIEKYVICNNCDIVHKVSEVFKSEIMWGKENLKSLVLTKEDIKFNLISQGKENLANILEQFDVETCDWEVVDFLLSNNKSGNIVLEKNEIDDNIVYKLLEINNNNFRIKKEIDQRFV